MIICNKCQTGTWTWVLGGQRDPFQNWAQGYLPPTLWLTKCLKLVPLAIQRLGLQPQEGLVPGVGDTGE